MFKLVISDDEGKTTVVPWVRDEITIGRKEGNTIRLTERNVSRKHARLRRAEGKLTLEDLGSYNGVRVNGRRIEKEASLQAGDQIAIGDYLIALQAEVFEAPTVPDAAPAKAASLAPVAAAPEPVPPARIVMTSPPAPGAEFALARPKMRIGRAEDLDIWINHRSISREHAEIQREDIGRSADGSQWRFKLIDLGSQNGVRVNGQDVQQAELRPGDILELGQVRFRFVGEGEAYTFDADRTMQVEALSLEPPAAKAPMLKAAAIVGGAVVVAALIALSSVPPTVPAPAPVPTQPPPDPVVATPAAAAVDPAIADSATTACEAALGAGRYAEAQSHADRALAAVAGHAGATSCRARATDGVRAEEVFTRGSAALDRGDVEEAYFTFGELPATSPLRQRDVVHAATERFARARLDQAEQSLRQGSNADAARFVNEALAVESLPRRMRAEAEQLLARTRAAATPRPPTSVEARPSSPRPSTAAANSPESGSPRVTPSPAEDPMEAARMCLRAGDHACVIRVLDGVSRRLRPNELSLLIATYKRMQDHQRARDAMREYINRYPNTTTAQSYQQELTGPASAP